MRQKLRQVRGGDAYKMTSPTAFPWIIAPRSRPGDRGRRKRKIHVGPTRLDGRAIYRRLFRRICARWILHRFVGIRDIDFENFPSRYKLQTGNLRKHDGETFAVKKNFNCFQFDSVEAEQQKPRILNTCNFWEGGQTLDPRIWVHPWSEIHADLISIIFHPELSFNGFFCFSFSKYAYRFGTDSRIRFGTIDENERQNDFANRVDWASPAVACGRPTAAKQKVARTRGK